MFLEVSTSHNIENTESVHERIKTVDEETFSK